ncbi:nucleotidyltransferase domain-containing protein [Leifsonia sp. NPDC058248]|uniref:nucleotidyltransferase domain-containing protein n=1 Tax=Leifsonia sp. NPDC058248 TaxID=3346402 RepID=UPI0036DB5A54
MKHHDAAIARFVERESAEPSCLAVVVTGSLARGTERPDSDVDLYVVVTEDRWQDAFARRRLMYTEDDGIGYAGGYFDIKLATLSYLDDAAERGDDPVRDSFASSRIVFSRVDDLAARIARIGDPADEDWNARVASFLAQARLHGGYFLQQASESGDELLLRHASVHLATSAARALLALNHVLFPGPKYLSKLVAGLDRKPDDFDALLAAVLADPSPPTADALLASLESFTGALLPKDETLSTFVLDNELAWRYRTKTPEYS